MQLLTRIELRLSSADKKTLFSDPKGSLNIQVLLYLNITNINHSLCLFLSFSLLLRLSLRFLSRLTSLLRQLSFVLLGSDVPCRLLHGGWGHRWGHWWCHRRCHRRRHTGADSWWWWRYKKIKIIKSISKIHFINSQKMWTIFLSLIVPLYFARLLFLNICGHFSTPSCYNHFIVGLPAYFSNCCLFFEGAHFCKF